MPGRLVAWLSKPGLLRALIAQARLAFRLIREPRVPALLKAIPLAAAIYVVSPIDLVPDVVPVLGQLDDLGVVLVFLELFLLLCPPGAKAFHEAAIASGRRYAPMAATDDVIDVEWRRQ